jgi:putative tryptophan/tyrosine transport system substrate-binding protein
MLYSMYPSPVWRWIDARGGMKPQMIFLRGKQLMSMYRPCYLDATGNPWAAFDISKTVDAARALGIELTSFEIGRAEEIDSVFDALKGRTDALYVLHVPLLFTNRMRIGSLAIDARLPTLCLVREYVEAGGLMSYGPNWPNMWRRAADLVDKILRGAKPAELPIEQPTEFDLVINLATAKALGLEVPLQLQQLANDVIE